MDNDTSLQAIRKMTRALDRDAKYLAEARAILNKGEYIAMHIIMQLMKDAGYEPDDSVDGGWVRR